VRLQRLLGGRNGSSPSPSLGLELAAPLSPLPAPRHDPASADAARGEEARQR